MKYQLIFRVILLLFFVIVFENKTVKAQTEPIWLALLSDTTGGAENSLDRFQGMTIDSIGCTYVLLGSGNSNITLSSLSKTSENGELLWKKTILPMSQNNLVHTITSNLSKLFIDTDGNLISIIQGFDIVNPNTYSMICMKFDLNGNLLKKTSVPVNVDASKSIERLVNGNYVFVHSKFVTQYHSEIIINEINSEFNLINSNSIPIIGNMFQFNTNELSEVLVENNTITFGYYYSGVYRFVQYNKSNLNLNWKDSLASNNVGDFGRIIKQNGSFTFYGPKGYRIYNGAGQLQKYVNIRLSNSAMFSNDELYFSQNNYDGNFALQSNFIGKVNILNDSVQYLTTNLTDSLLIAGDPILNDNNMWIMFGKYDNLNWSTGQINLEKIIIEKRNLSNQVHANWVYTPQFKDYKEFKTLALQFDGQNNLIVLASCYSNPYFDSTINSTRYHTANLLFKIKNSSESLSSSGSVSGEIFIDSNANCISDSNEIKIPQNLVKLMPDNTYLISNSKGQFKGQKSLNSNLVQLIPFQGFSNLCDSTLYKPLNSNQNDTINFGYTNLIVKKDLAVFITSNNLRPGFDSYHYLTLTNNSLLPVNNVASVLEFKLDNHLIINSAIPTPDSIVNNTVYWTINNIGTNTSLNYLIDCTLPNNVPIGTPIQNLASVEPIQNELDLFNNIDSLNILVIGSFDPNDINATPNGSGIENCIYEPQKLTYTIRFQNTGNDTAFFIRIFNPIDPNLNIETLKFLSSSHSFEATLEKNILKFHFNNILLVDSFKDEAKSHGYISYSILPSANFTKGKINNSAEIYFDYNSPVSTNTHTIKFGDCVIDDTIKTINNVLSFNVFPNPLKEGNLKININSDIGQNVNLEMYDLVGRLIVPIYKGKINVGSNSFGIPRQSLSSGIYFISLKLSNKKSFQEKIVFLD